MNIEDERSLDIIDYIGSYSGCPIPDNPESMSHLDHYLHFASLVTQCNTASSKCFSGRKVLDIGSGEGFGSYYFYLKC